jgi:N-methylhydantoinase A
MGYHCNVDTGGTHTDAAVINEQGRIVEAKVPSTPDDFSRGFFKVLEETADKIGMELGELLQNADRVTHGTTVGTNAIIEDEGVDAALVTTHGAEDAIFLMRGALGRGSGLPIEELLNYHTASKPDPIIPKNKVFGINERVDCMGDVVVEFNETQAREVVEQINGMDIDAVGVNFLWSFLNNDHEEKMISLLEEELDDVFITKSSDLVPQWGEYERAVAVAINVSVGPITADYINNVNTGLRERGYDKPLLVMFVGGGVGPAEEAIREPIRTIDSGPAAGVVGCSYLANRLDHDNVIAADMGGTSFDIGLITEGEPLTKSKNVINQYDYTHRNIDIESIGSGGGSIAKFEKDTNRLEVGPESAGADPGPACYDQGGVDATVTDADLLLGFLDPDYFLGGQASLNRKRAEESIEGLAEDMNRDVESTAAGIVRIANAQMADAVRNRTINKGFDPRRFRMYAYGGAGPLHAPFIAKELDIDSVVIPGGSASSVWSALGISSSDLLHREEVSNIRTMAPFDADDINEQLNEIEATVRNKLYDEGFQNNEIRFERYVNLGYAAQVHELAVPVPPGTLTEEDVDELIQRFEDQYESLYGKDAGASETGYELTGYRVDGYGEVPSPTLERSETGSTATSRDTKDILWPNEEQTIETAVYYQEDVGPGMDFEGPTVIRMENTTIVIPPRTTCNVDKYSNFNIQFGGD